MRISLQPAFVLHSRAYRETCVMLDLLTADFGRISAVAKSVRQQTSKLKPLVQPFVPLLVSWQGEGELLTLKALEPNGHSPRLMGDCLLSGLYLNELLMRVLHKNDPNPQLYTIYQETLIELQSPVELQKRLRIFEKNLLEMIGYGLQLDYEASTNQLISERYEYHFQSDHGFTRCTIEHNELQRFSGKSLLSLANEQLDDDQALYDAKKIMRLALAPLLGHYKLRSRELFIKTKSESTHE
jgi:DNA repair protein RecO (recombination protein O)